jgi:zinc-binding alcohol dehydrogenase/oxidoreductase
MKALVLEKADGLDCAAIGEVDTPQPAAGEVRVALRAAALNHRELWITRGLYPGMQLPTTMGADGAGAFGCLGMPYAGTIADYICAPADSVVAKPAHLDMAAAAAVPLAGLTAWRALITKAQLKSGDNVLVTGIGGGVATWALTFAKAMGANVFVTSSSQEKIDWAAQMGASGGVNYKEEKWGKALGAMSGGIDVVIDGAPANSVTQYGRTLNMGARVVIYGSTGGMSFEMAATDLFLRHATLYGSAMGSLDDFKSMMAFVREKRLEPAIDQSFPFEQASEALQYLEREHSIGKVVITI